MFSNTQSKSDNVNTSNILTLNELIEDKKNDYSDTQYLVQNKVLESFCSSISYGLYSKIDTSNMISKLMYVGNGYFITILLKDIFNSISRFASNYYVVNLNQRQTIVSIIGYSMNIDNMFTVSLIQLDSNSDTCFEFNIITPNMYLDIEQRNTKVSYEIGNSVITSSIWNINETYITVNDNKNNFSIGAPLFINNTLIGIYYRKNANVCNFYRLSSISNWLDKYRLINKNKVINGPIYIPYTNEQLYQIILSLNNRILELENKINMSNSNK